jgi:transketolase
MTFFDENSRKLASLVRKHVIRMTHSSGASHVSSSLSSVDILVILYEYILNTRPEIIKDPKRDRFILSKGHGCAALYAVLAEKDFFPIQWLEDFYVDGSKLLGHATFGVPGIEFSTGSLGHGLSVSCGMAYAAKYDNLNSRVFTLLSDGECDEGSTWEAALFAPHHKLDNLIAIIDYNKMQALGSTRNVMELEPFVDKWTAFGWAVKEVDGHDHSILKSSLREVPFCSGKPSCLVAHTVKGKGVSFMENEIKWHYRSPDENETRKALMELEEGR